MSQRAPALSESEQHTLTPAHAQVASGKAHQLRRRPGQRPTREQIVEAKRVFLEGFERTGNVRASCQAASISRTTVYQWREHDEAFRAAFQVAEVEFEDVLEAEVLRRAVHGVQEPVVSLGKVVHDASGQLLMVTRYSDRLLVKLLTARHRRYRHLTQRVEMSGSQGTPVEAVDRQTITLDVRTLSAEQLAAIVESIPADETHGVSPSSV
jgi:hypothetical protein